MAASASSQSEYHKHYLSENRADSENYRAKARGYHRRFGHILDAAQVSSCLDIGCAIGLLAGYLRGRGIADVVGVDLDA